ncbi:hypothetical protein UlMin_045443 [Ulmus minor]
MVWFQCEDCGDDLKKHKFPNHFRICSASKLSCIDCGETFGQQNIQSHNYATPKPNKDAKQQPDFDINVGLYDRPPWFCSICNTKATSKQTLLLYAEGKKHKAKLKRWRKIKIDDDGMYPGQAKAEEHIWKPLRRILDMEFSKLFKRNMLDLIGVIFLFPFVLIYVK